MRASLGPVTMPPTSTSGPANPMECTIEKEPRRLASSLRSLRTQSEGVQVSPAMRDAWMRAMTRALDECAVAGEVRAFVEAKLGDVATMLRNAPDP